MHRLLLLHPSNHVIRNRGVVHCCQLSSTTVTSSGRARHHHHGHGGEQRQRLNQRSTQFQYLSPPLLQSSMQTPIAFFNPQSSSSLQYHFQPNINNSAPPLASNNNYYFSTVAMIQENEAEVKVVSSTQLLQQEQHSNSTTKTKAKQQRKPMKKRDPLIITPTAAARIEYLIQQHNNQTLLGSGSDDGSNNNSSASEKEHSSSQHHQQQQPPPQHPAVGIRLGTKKRGCNGLSYTLNYAYANHSTLHPRDEFMTISLPSPSMPGNGLKVYVEPMALMNIIGTTMDYVDDEMSSEFTFTNPNSKGECGCGESFNV